MRNKLKELFASQSMRKITRTACKITLAFMIVAAEAVTSRCYIYWLHAPVLPPSMKKSELS